VKHLNRTDDDFYFLLKFHDIDSCFLKMGFTALVGASVKGHAATVELLLRAGANTEAIDEVHDLLRSAEVIDTFTVGV